MQNQKTMQNLFKSNFLYLAQYFVALPIIQTCFPKVIQPASSYQLDYKGEHYKVYSGAFWLCVTVPGFF